MNKGKLALIFVLVALVSVFIYFDIDQFLNLQYLKSEQGAFVSYVEQNPMLAALIAFCIYIVVTAASLPGAAIMTLAIGATFGLWWGLLIVSFASTIGATLAMLAARFILGDQVQRRFSRQLKGINKGVEKEGAFYLFTLRLVPVVPFFVINLAMGLTKISVPLFFIVSQVGMFAGTIVFVNAGTN